MTGLVVALLTALVPPLVAAAGALLSARRDRGVALREIELLEQLNPESTEALYVRDLIGRRIRSWWHRETASTRMNATVALSCLTGLYVLTVAALFVTHDSRRAAIDAELATGRGDRAAATVAEFAGSELGRLGNTIAVFIYLLAALGLLHSLIWLARFLLDRRRWLEHPYRVPAADLLRTDEDDPVDAESEMAVVPGSRPQAAALGGTASVWSRLRSWRGR